MSAGGSASPHLDGCWPSLVQPDPSLYKPGSWFVARFKMDVAITDGIPLSYITVTAKFSIPQSERVPSPYIEYSPVRPNSGLHPRPSSPSKLIPFFPSQHISPEYQSTLFPSRKGESLAEIHDRAELFVEAWVGRVESEWPEVKCVVIFAHAASLIALGRALTGDRTLDVIAGCASTSLYQRKPPSSFSLGSSSNRSLTDLTKSRSTSSLNAADSLLALSTTSPSNTATGTGSSETASSSTSSTLPCGVGQWSIVYNGRADYLPNGLERNWSFADVVLKEDGEVVFDNGDGEGHQVEDEWPEGLRDGADRWLRRGRPPFGAGAGAGGQGSKM
nr:uncharacterized protein CI109_006529 [Kwoniella shandongensis]KAA5525159.1 hypothetical protein CI109_006529 [Kwoniella shandongensis]